MRLLQNNGCAKKRIDWIDAAKGVAILLVIIGHTLDVGIPIENICRGLIFSFHMPLFFVLSGFTFQLSTNTEQFSCKTNRAFRHLIVPALFLFMLQAILTLVMGLEVFDWQFLKDKALALLYSSGVSLDVEGKRVPAIGMLWFLVVLFFSRSMYDFMQMKIKSSNFYLTVVLLACMGVWCGQFVFLIFSFDIVFAILPFFILGSTWKNKFVTINLLEGIMFGGIWILTFLVEFINKNEYLELATRAYPLFPLSYITAFAGVLFVCSICQFIVKKWSDLCYPLLFLGKNSIYLYGIHFLDKNYEIIWRGGENNFYDAFVRISIDVILMISIIKIYKYVLTFKKR